jgi:hypothetical protein
MATNSNEEKIKEAATIGLLAAIASYGLLPVFRSIKGQTEKSTEASKIEEAQVKENSEKLFREKVEEKPAPKLNVQVAKSIVSAEESQKTTKNGLSEEKILLNQKAEALAKELDEAVKAVIQTNDEKLIQEVFTFSKKYMSLLLASTIEKPVTNEKLAEIKSELRHIELKVHWVGAQKDAKLKFEKELEIQKQDVLDAKAKNEAKLQRRMFIYFSIYALVMLLLSLAGNYFLPSNTIIPVIGIPLSIIVWGALGSLASMLYRFYKRSEVQDIEQEIRWLFARPLAGIIMGSIVYLLAVSGAVLIGISDIQTLNIKMEFLWLFAFAGGFSDKVFESVVERVGLITKSNSSAITDFNQIMELISENRDELNNKLDQDSSVGREEK